MLGFCRQRGLPTEGIRIIQRMVNDPSNGMVGKVELEIQVPPSFPEKYLPAMIRAAELCAVKRHMEQPPAFGGSSRNRQLEGTRRTRRRCRESPCSEIDARIDAQKRQLDELLRKYTDQHPDVVGVKRTMARLEDERNAEIEARAKEAADKPDPSFSGNPIAQQLKVALNESEATVTTARARLGEHEARYNQLRAAAESLPKIETELGQLDRDYDVQKRQYDSLIQRRETANLSGKLEDANVAEFRIVEPPRVSPKPVAPNRLLLLAALLGGSLAAGLVSAFAVSQVRPTFHGGRALAEVAGRPLLGIISVVLNPEIRHRQRRSTLVFAGGMGGLLVCFGATFAFTLLTLRSY